MHALTLQGRPLPAGTNRSDVNTWFLSGHATVDFGLAVACGTAASMRGYRCALAVWTVGLSLATASSYLRLAGDRHYLSDVLVGGAAGAAIGFVVPFVFHAPASRARGPSHALAMDIAQVPGGGTLGVQGTW